MSDTITESCLQCGQTRTEVHENQTICGIEDGYEYVELVAEWPRHHWRDWSDAELGKAGIKPVAYEKYRRTAALSLQYAPCDDQITGHRGPGLDHTAMGLRVNECIFCGASVEAKP